MFVICSYKQILPKVTIVRTFVNSSYCLFSHVMLSVPFFILRTVLSPLVQVRSDGDKVVKSAFQQHILFLPFINSWKHKLWTGPEILPEDWRDTKVVEASTWFYLWCWIYFQWEASEGSYWAWAVCRGVEGDLWKLANANE